MRVEDGEAIIVKIGRYVRIHHARKRETHLLATGDIVTFSVVCLATWGKDAVMSQSNVINVMAFWSCAMFRGLPERDFLLDQYVSISRAVGEPGRDVLEHKIFDGKHENIY